MKQTEAFLNALQEWEESAQPKIQDFGKLIFFLGYKLGLKVAVADFKMLEERIKYLIQNERIDEDLIVNGLVNAVTEILERNIELHGELILDNEQLLKSKFLDEANKEFVKRELEFLKDRRYLPQARHELDVWNKIVAKNLSKAERRRWELERAAHEKCKNRRHH